MYFAATLLALNWSYYTFLFEEQCLTNAYVYIYIATYTATQYLTI